MQANPLTNDCALVNCRSLMHTAVLYSFQYLGCVLYHFVVSFTHKHFHHLLIFGLPVLNRPYGLGYSEYCAASASLITLVNKTTATTTKKNPSQMLHRMYMFLYHFSLLNC